MDSVDKLIITYDESKGKDHTCLIVGKQICRAKFILNTFYDDEAVEMYHKLTGK